MHTVEVSVLTNVDPTKTNRVRVLEEQAVDRNVFTYHHISSLFYVYQVLHT